MVHPLWRLSRRRSWSLWDDSFDCMRPYWHIFLRYDEFRTRLCTWVGFSSRDYNRQVITVLPFFQIWFIVRVTKMIPFYKVVISPARYRLCIWIDPIGIATYWQITLWDITTYWFRVKSVSIYIKKTWKFFLCNKKMRRGVWNKKKLNIMRESIVQPWA